MINLKRRCKHHYLTKLHEDQLRWTRDARVCQYQPIESEPFEKIMQEWSSRVVTGVAIDVEPKEAAVESFAIN